MPYISAKFSTPVSETQEKDIKTALGKAITILGKSENYLMVEIEPERKLYFHGSNDEPVAFFEVKLLGSAPKSKYEELTAKLCETALDVLDIHGDNVYVKFEEVEYWGYNSFMF